MNAFEKKERRLDDMFMNDAFAALNGADVGVVFDGETGQWIINGDEYPHEIVKVARGVDFIEIRTIEDNNHSYRRIYTYNLHNTVRAHRLTRKLEHRVQKYNAQVDDMNLRFLKSVAKSLKKPGTSVYMEHETPVMQKYRISNPLDHDVYVVYNGLLVNFSGDVSKEFNTDDNRRIARKLSGIKRKLDNKIKRQAVQKTSGIRALIQFKLDERALDREM